MQFIKYPSLTNHYTARRQKFINFDDDYVSTEKIHLVMFGSPANITRSEMETTISRYRWFGDEVLDIYKSNPHLLCKHRDSRFLLQMLYPNEKLSDSAFQVPDDMTFYKSHMTVVQKIKYGTLSDDTPWSQIWGYVKSRPTSVVSEVRDAIKLQFRNQSYYNII